ncbi:hypothetical protein UVI_02025540 [Ustilaginoidea virens]|uniref:HPP transmembrane region domain-containing protein n=1 Tax=Ustilaginoidea virens TaxID=1159556 RepID=A0A1B5KTB7_USTVR|nr:hypothetical protein UVI_02025540 [Ustilaginoidea virens]
MSRPRSWNFNIDHYLNPFVPSPPWKYLPYPLTWFLGYRKTKPQETGNLVAVFWAFIGVFASLVLIQAVSTRVPSFESHGAPIIVGSFGAAAVLEFYTIEAPLAQPRNAIVGQLIATVIGIAVAKLFQLNHEFERVRWVAGALACALATALMALTKTVHPPAGATALLAVVDTTLVRIGWFLLPVVMLGCALMLGVALLVNNIQRRFPIYWWTPDNLGRTEPILQRPTSDEVKEHAPDPQPSWARDSGPRFNSGLQHPQEVVVIKRGVVLVPGHMYLTQEEAQLLETMSLRL